MDTQKLPMKNVTVGIKTFLRPQTLAQCLESLRLFDFAEVIVADDSPENSRSEYAAVYEHYQTLLPLRVIWMPYDTGLAASRNQIAESTSTELLLLLDDDQIVNETVTLMYDTLLSDEHLGGVSCFFYEKGRQRCTACDLYRENGYVVKALRKTPRILCTKHGTRYALFDFIPSATLFRLACLRDISWDPFYKIEAEHLDFYLRHKQLKRWAFAVALDAHIHHIRYDCKEHNNTKYRSHRKGPKTQRSWQYFNKKFNVHGKIEGVKLADNPHKRHPAHPMETP